MKKISLIVILFLLSLYFLAPSSKVNAQIYEEGIIETTPGATEIIIENDATDSGKIEYELPYPGMLPDNPFYPLKMLRDKIVKTLISDSFKKAQFNLLTGQKRLFAGKLLIEKKKQDLAMETIEKSGHYLDDALKDIKQAQKDNPKNVDIKPFLEHFKTVAGKHQEIIKDLKPEINKRNAVRFEKQEKRIADILKNVEFLIEQY